MKLAKSTLLGLLFFSQWVFPQNIQITNNGVFYPEFSIQKKLRAPESLRNHYSLLPLKSIRRLFKIAQNAPLPFDFIGNCCFERGYRVSQLLNLQGAQGLRVIARGKMKTSLKDKWGQPVYWEKHTATALVDTGQKLWIIDPSLAQSPLSLNHWLSLFVDQSEKINLLIGHQFVFDEEDIFSPLIYKDYQRAQVEEVVRGSLLGCQFIQDRNNRKQRKPDSTASCQILSQNLVHTQKNEVSDFWAQELVGLDLAREWLAARRSKILHRPLVHIWDEPVKKVEPDNQGRGKHAYSVQSFFEMGPQAASDLARVASNQDVIYDYRGYIQGAQNLKKLKETQLINLSAGWRSYVDSIKKALDLVGTKNTIIVKAAGNRPLRSAGESEYEPERSDFVRVGSLAPNGLITDYSAVRGDWVIYAPSDRFLTARASPSGQMTQFDGTSGAAPLVTGALANYLSLNPQVSREKAQEALIGSAFEFRDDSGMTHHYVINAFRLLFVGLDTQAYREEVGLISAQGLRARNQLIEQFPACFGYQPFLSQQLSSCQQKTNDLKDFRRLFYLEPNNKMAESISCIYKNLGFKKESQFFSNWAASETGKLGTQISSQENTKSVLARNARLLSTQSLRQIFQQELSEKFELKSDLGLALMLRPEIKPGWAEDLDRSLTGNRDRAKFFELIETVPGLRGEFLPKIALRVDDDLAMTLLEVFYNTEDQELMAKILNLVDRPNERIWMKMANFLDHYLPQVRATLAQKLIQKPSEEVQLRVLEFTSAMELEELQQILELARKSSYYSVRSQAQKFRTPRPKLAQ
jgi:hypothetical protein